MGTQDQGNHPFLENLSCEAVKELKEVHGSTASTVRSHILDTNKNIKANSFTVTDIYQAMMRLKQQGRLHKLKNKRRFTYSVGHMRPDKSKKGQQKKTK